MTIGIKDNKTGILTVCCISQAADLIGVERNSLYRMLKKKAYEYKHYTIHPDVKNIPLKKRGKMNTLLR